MEIENYSPKRTHFSRGKFTLKGIEKVSLQKENEQANLPISLELVIKSELCPSLHSSGSKEADSELTVHCPLRETTI